MEKNMLKITFEVVGVYNSDILATPINSTIVELEQSNPEIHCKVNVSIRDEDIAKYIIFIDLSRYGARIYEIIKYVNTIVETANEVSKTNNFVIFDMCTNIHEFISNIETVDKPEMVTANIFNTVKNYRIDDFLKQSVTDIMNTFKVDYTINICYRTDTIHIKTDCTKEDSCKIHDVIAELFDQLGIDMVSSMYALSDEE